MAKSGAVWAHGFPAAWRLPPRATVSGATYPCATWEHHGYTQGRGPQPGCAQCRTMQQVRKTMLVQGWLRWKRGFPVP